MGIQITASPKVIDIMAGHVVIKPSAVIFAAPITVSLPRREYAPIRQWWIEPTTLPLLFLVPTLEMRGPPGPMERFSSASLLWLFDTTAHPTKVVSWR